MKKSFRLPDGTNSAPKDVEREIDLHIDLRAREFEATGMSRDDARRAALEAFGDRSAIAREVTDIRRSTVDRRQRRAWFDELRQDLVVGARMLRRSPSFTLVALLTLTIGIGANTAIFSVLHSVLLRPLPYAQPEQLVQVWSDHRARGRAEPEWLSAPDFVDWRDGNSTFASMAVYRGWAPDLTGDGDPESLAGLVVSGSFFDLLRTTPALGRLLAPTDDDASAERVIVLSHAFWERRYGADRSIVGRRLMLSGDEWTVAGVLPESFHAPVATPAPDVIAAIRRPPNAPCGRGCLVLQAIGRLKPGVTVAAAQADLGRVAARLAQEYPQTNAKVGAWLIPLHEQITGPTKRALLTLSIAVALVLLIGCVNLANLLLVRGATRSREIGVRAALGAGRGRVVRQLLTENALLALGGGALGVAVGVLGSRAFAVLVPDTVRQVQEIHADAGVFTFAAGITLLAALLFGLVPAVSAVRAGLMTSLRSGTRQTGQHGNALRSALVVTQLSFAVVLLVSAGLLMRSFLAMQRVDLGFRSDGVYLTNVRFPVTRYPDATRAHGAIDEVVTRLRANPAVRSVEVTDVAPLGNSEHDMTVIPVGGTFTPGQPPSIWYRFVSIGYLSAMQMRLVAGRAFTAGDRLGVPRVAIINEEAARKLWPAQNPVGRVLGPQSPTNPGITVIGVVASAHNDGPNEPIKPEMFLSMGQFPIRGGTLVLQPTRDAVSLAAAVRQALHDVDPLVPMSTLDPMEQIVGTAIALPRLYATLVGLFASAALLLAALGVYGVMAYAVTQRQREIGVRLALGAEPSSIRRMVLGEGGRLTLIGLGIGLVGALLTGQVLGTLLFGVSRYDAATFVTVPCVLGVVTVIASWLPARRAMHLDPLTAIREE